jgi:anthranilate phosphoribosyltransferase
MRGFYEAMQAQTFHLTPPVAKPMPIVIPSYNGARKQANLTPLLAILLHKLGFPVVVHGVSEDPTRVLTETIFEMLGIEPTLHAGQAQAKLDGHQPVYIPVKALCPPLEKQLDMRWRMGCVTAPTRWRNWRRHLLKMQRCAFPVCRIPSMSRALLTSLMILVDGHY